jgi:hypothetical protein
MNCRSSRMPSTHVSKMDAIPGGELARPGGDLVRKTPGALHTYGVRRLSNAGPEHFVASYVRKLRSWCTRAFAPHPLSRLRAHYTCSPKAPIAGTRSQVPRRHTQDTREVEPYRVEGKFRIGTRSPRPPRRSGEWGQSRGAIRTSDVLRPTLSLARDRRRVEATPRATPAGCRRARRRR